MNQNQFGRRAWLRYVIERVQWQIEAARIDEAYRLQPDSADEADDWSDPLPWEPESAAE